VYLLDDAIAEHVPLSLEAWRNRFVSKEPPPQPEPTPPTGDEPPAPEGADGGAMPGGEEP
jgi:hypothetical protein